MSGSASEALHTELEQIQSDIQRYQPTGKATLVAVTKYASLEQMRHLFEAGVRHFGENKVQDALAKKEQLPPEISQAITWHLIGHLQSNKVNKAVGAFDWIHSVDSLELAQKISRRAGELGIVQQILLQVNISGEESKEGFSELALLNDWDQIINLPYIKIGGLMTIAPATNDEEMLKRIFNELAHLLKTCQNLFSTDFKATTASKEDFVHLSMGMSDDYKPALSCGATFIRIGRRLILHS